VPFISKATGRPLAKIAALCMVGKTLEELGHTTELEITHKAVKESSSLRSVHRGRRHSRPRDEVHRRVMGLADDFPMAFAKAQLAAGFGCRAQAVRCSFPSRTTTSGHRGSREAAEDPWLSTDHTSGTHRYLAGKGVETLKVDR